MKISFEKKIILGFIGNLLVVVASGWIHLLRIQEDRNSGLDQYLNWASIGLFVLSLVLLTVVYFIIRGQLRVNAAAQLSLFENKQLLQSIIDNSTNAISIKKLNGEYMLINKRYEGLFHISGEEIKGKTDHDFLPKEIADQYRNSDMEVVKLGKEIKVEEKIMEQDVPLTFLAVKFPLFEPNGRVYAVGTIATNISERKEAESSLRVGDAFFNLSMDPLIIASNDSFIKVNKATTKTLGYSEEELLGQPFMSFVHPDDVAKTLNEVEKLQKGVITVNFENRYLCKDGTYRWLNWTTYPDPETGLLYAVARDVTAQKEYESSLKAGDNFFQMSLDILVIASGNTFQKFNPALSNTLGYAEKDLKDIPFISFVHPEDVDITLREIEKLQSGISTISFENRWRCKDGTYKWLEWTASPDISTGLLYAVAHDITEKKATDAELEIANRFFNMSFDMFVVAKGEYFIKVNPAFTRLLGYDQKDMDDRPFLEFTHAEDLQKSVDIVSKMQKGDSIVNYRARAKCKDGSYKWLEWTSSIELESGLFYAVARDVTEELKTEESLNMVNNLFEMSFDVLFVAKDQKFIKVNPAFLSELGYSASEIINKSILEVLHPDHQKIAVDRITQLMNGGKTSSFVYQVLCKDGTYKLIEVVTTADASRGMIYSVGRNVTDRVKDEESLKMADQFFRMSFDILAVGKENEYVKVNPSFTRSLGYSNGDLKDLSMVKLTHPDDRTVAEQVMEKLRKGETIINYRDRVMCKDKTVKWMEWNITIDKETGMIYSCARDITEQTELEMEQHKAVSELYENEEKLRLILENINEGVIVTNAQKKVLLANYMANELFGAENDHEISANLTDQFELYLPDEKTVFPSQNLPLDRALNGESTDDIDLVLWNPEAQEKRRVLISGRPLVDTENHVVAAVLTIKDISKYKQMEQELKETELKYRRLIGFKKDEENDKIA
jgi:PAS domain S-box-containing protein